MGVLVTVVMLTLHEFEFYSFWDSLTYVSTSSIQTGKLNVVLSSISPVDAAVNVIQGEAIRPSDLGVHYDAPVSSIHAYLAN